MSEKKKSTKVKGKNNGRFYLIVVVLIIIIAIAVYAIVQRNSENTEVAVDDDTSYTDDEEEVEEYVTVLDDGTKLNTSDALAETKTLNGLEVTNTQLTYDSTGNSVLLADITNTTDSAVESKSVKIDILDDEGNVLMTLNGLLQDIDAGATVQFNMGVSADIANAYDFTIYE